MLGPPPGIHPAEFLEPLIRDRRFRQAVPVALRVLGGGSGAGDVGAGPGASSSRRARSRARLGRNRERDRKRRKNAGTPQHDAQSGARTHVEQAARLLHASTCKFATRSAMSCRNGINPASGGASKPQRYQREKWCRR